MKTEDLFGKVLKYKDKTEARDYLWMLHLVCEEAGVDLEISESDNSEMILIVGGSINGIVVPFNKGCLSKDDILSIFSSVMRYMFSYSNDDLNKKQ